MQRHIVSILPRSHCPGDVLRVMLSFGMLHWNQYSLHETGSRGAYLHELRKSYFLGEPSEITDVVVDTMLMKAGNADPESSGRIANRARRAVPIRTPLPPPTPLPVGASSFNMLLQVLVWRACWLRSRL